MARPSNTYRVKKIVSGGQTGADRGALDAAQSLGLDQGGWCPKGRLAEDGVIPDRYQLTETESEWYRIRTEQNVIDSDGTLIFYYKKPKGGTELTRRMVIKHAKPHLLYDLDSPLDDQIVQDWLAKEKINVLNVAGPRESSLPGISVTVRTLLLRLLKPGTTDEH